MRGIKNVIDTPPDILYKSVPITGNGNTAVIDIPDSYDYVWLFIREGTGNLTANTALFALTPQHEATIITQITSNVQSTVADNRSSKANSIKVTAGGAGCRCVIQAMKTN